MNGSLFSAEDYEEGRVTSARAAENETKTHPVM